MSSGKICAFPKFKALGVKADCEKLIVAFMETESVRFKEFSDLWRERKFSYLFAGRISEKELMEFTEECLLIALSFALSPHPFHWRTGGLYLMYAFYFKQPQTCKVPIRVTRDEWKDIKEYIREASEGTHHDIHYVFRMLEISNAFQFVAFRAEHSPTVPQGTVQDSISTSESGAEANPVVQFIEGGCLKHLEQLQKTYTYMKSEVLPEDNFSSISPDLYADVCRSFEEFKLKENKYQRRLFGKDAEDPDTDDEYKGNIGAHRRALKERSLRRKAGPSGARRTKHSLVNAPSTSRLESMDLDDYDPEGDASAIYEDSGPALSMPVLDKVEKDDSLRRGGRRKKT